MRTLVVAAATLLLAAFVPSAQALASPDRIGEVQTKAQMLSLELNELKQQLRRARQLERKLRERLPRIRRRLRELQPQVQVLRDRDRQLRRRFDLQAYQYIELTQALNHKALNAGDTNTQLLSYIAETSRPDEAMLVYQSARALLERQAEMLRELRASAQQAALAHAQLKRVAGRRRKLVREYRTGLQTQRRLIRRQRAAVKRKRTQLRRYRRLQLLYESLSGMPFPSSLDGLGVGERIVALARAELRWGVKEVPPGSNDSPDIARYRSAVAGARVGPWCAYFVSYIAARAGVPLGERGQGFGLVADVERWARRTQRWFEPKRMRPLPGDLVVFPGHTGIVERVRGKTLLTIEGNTSNALRRRERPLVGGRPIRGFVRLDPAYPSPPASPGRVTLGPSRRSDRLDGPSVGV